MTLHRKADLPINFVIGARGSPSALVVSRASDEFGVHRGESGRDFKGTDVAIEIFIFIWITASIASIPLIKWPEPVQTPDFPTFTRSSGLAFASLAHFKFGASMLFFPRALAQIAGTTTSISMYLVPVFGDFLAITMFRERLNLLEIIGAAIALAASPSIVKL